MNVEYTEITSPFFFDVGDTSYKKENGKYYIFLLCDKEGHQVAKWGLATEAIADLLDYYLNTNEKVSKGIIKHYKFENGFEFLVKCGIYYIGNIETNIVATSIEAKMIEVILDSINKGG